MAAQGNVSVRGLLRQVPDAELEEEVSCGQVICWRSTGKEGKTGSLEWRPRLYLSRTPLAQGYDAAVAEGVWDGRSRWQCWQYQPPCPSARGLVNATTATLPSSLRLLELLGS